MAITAQRLLTELGDRAWSGFNKDDMIFGNEDARTAQAELNAAIRYLINLEDFPFRNNYKTFKTSKNQAKYSIPNGKIDSIYCNDNQEKLEYLGDGIDLDKALTGEPTGYYVAYRDNIATLKLYPIPDRVKEYTITYSDFFPIRSADDSDFKMEFTSANDVMNIPENLEHLFMDCVVLRTIQTNNKDLEDENYEPTISEFNEAWQVFKNKAKPVRTEYRVRIWQ